VTRTRVSRPDRSVTCTKVSLKEAKRWATANTSSPSTVLGPSSVSLLIYMIYFCSNVCISFLLQVVYMCWMSVKEDRKKSGLDDVKDVRS